MTRTPSSSRSSTTAADAAPERLRLLLLTDTPIVSAGGSERFLRNLLSRLPPDRYAVTVVQLNGASRDLQGHRLVDHVLLHTLDVGPVYGPRGWRALRHLRGLVRRERFHVIQSQHEKSDLLNALLPRSAGHVRISNRRDMGFNKSPRLRLLFRFLNHRFDCVVAPSRPILSDLGQGESLRLQRMVWIPNGVDADRFAPPSDAHRREVRASLGLPADAIVFGCVASLTPVKRHADLVDAFALLHRELPDAALLLVGDGPLRGEIEAQVERLGLQGAVHLVGDRSNVEALLPALDVAVLASSTEGMSNAILEAMACGLPVIATAVGGNLHLVRDRDSGRLVPPREPPALAAAMRELAHAPGVRASMGRSARERIEREFSLDGMARAFDCLYRRLLGWA